MTYNFNLDYVVDTIKKNRAKTVGLQFPDGFKRKAIAISKKIENHTDSRVIISANSCFGACDIDTRLLESVNLLFHFGHAEIPNIKVNNVVFIELESDIDLLPVLKKAVEVISDHVGLVSTVQFVHKLYDVQRYLGEHGIHSIISNGDMRIAYPGLVLGCNFSAVPDCDEYLYIGTGDFHALGVSLATRKTVRIADPVINEIRRPDADKVLRQRCAAIERSLDAQSFGIIVSTKIGQCRKDLAYDLCCMAEDHGLDAHILMMDMVTPEMLLPFNLDVYVNTACPRIAIDNAALFPVPMLTPIEFEVVIGERKWEDLVFDEIL
ncbi:MAG: diphthamide biosynthesis enzyme Dph2 [Euryarchaeota archaeon]|nr:diphthamide biosynthesis enzyme Dph2 [Euryarchaeota archaeon]